MAYVSALFNYSSTTGRSLFISAIYPDIEGSLAPRMEQQGKLGGRSSRLILDTPTWKGSIPTRVVASEHYYSVMMVHVTEHDESNFDTNTKREYSITKIQMMSLEVAIGAKMSPGAKPS